MIKYRWGGVGWGWDNNVHVPVYTHNDGDDDDDDDDGDDDDDDDGDDDDGGGDDDDDPHDHDFHGCTSEGNSGRTSEWDRGVQASGRPLEPGLWHLFLQHPGLLHRKKVWRHVSNWTYTLKRQKCLDATEAATTFEACRAVH